MLSLLHTYTVNQCIGLIELEPNNALYLTAIPLRSIAAGELGRYTQITANHEIAGDLS